MEAIDAAISPEINNYNFILKFFIQTEGLSIEPLMVCWKVFDLQLTLFLTDVLVHHLDMIIDSVHRLTF